MQYLYSEKSLARDVFDAAKAKLRKPFPDASPTPRHWLDAMNYGGNFMPIDNSVKFHSMNGMRLRIASAPRYTRDPSAIGRLPDASLPLAAEAKGQCKEAAQSASQPAAGTPASGNPGADGARPTEGIVGNRPDDDAQGDATQPSSSTISISTPVLSTMLALTVAVTVGIIVGNNNSVKLEIADGKHGDIAIVDARMASEISTPAPRLAQDAVPPSQLSAAPGSKPATQARQLRQIETRARHRTAPRPAIRKPQAGAGNGRLAAAGKKNLNAKSPAGDVAARKASVRPAHGVAAAAARQHQAPKDQARLGTLYARCENMRGVLRQERCRWAVCGGNWGKQGCPAYQHKTLQELGYGLLPPSAAKRAPEEG